MKAVYKARSNWSNMPTPRRGTRVPGVFRPPYGGTSYYGQSYKWQQVLEYKHWAFVAITAWIREIAGGEPCKLGRAVRHEDKPLRPRVVTPNQPANPPKAFRFGKPVRKALGGPKEHHDFEPFDEGHPIVQVFNNPNGPDVAYDLWAYHTLFLKLTGESHWWVIRNQFGVPVEIWVIPSHWLRLQTDHEGQPVYYNVQSPWGGMIDIPYEDVVSFYEHSPLNRYEGMAVNQAIAEWLDGYDSLVRMRLAVWKNGGIPAFHVQLGEAYMDPDEAFLNRFYSRWFARFQGENNSGKPLITGADVTVHPIEGHRPADALNASNESEEKIRNATLAAYGVPQAVVGLTENLTYGSVEASKDAFRQYSVNSLLTYMGQVITEKIIKPTPGCDDGICYWEDRSTGDPDYRLKEQEQDLNTGVKTVNEVRVERGLAPYDYGGNDPMVGGVPMPWATGASEENPELTRAFHKAMGESNGSSGGYLMNGGRLNGHKVNGAK